MYDDLITQLESATKGDGRLDLQIYRTLTPAALWFRHDGCVDPPPNYTQSLDAAVTLIPNPLGSMSLATTFACGGFADARPRGAWAKVWHNTSMAGAPYDPPPYEAKDAPSVALAICIAALKARKG